MFAARLPQGTDVLGWGMTSMTLLSYQVLVEKRAAQCLMQCQGLSCATTRSTNLIFRCICVTWFSLALCTW